MKRRESEDENSERRLVWTRVFALFVLVISSSDDNAAILQPVMMKIQPA
jgi:hypothetical protein